MAALLLALGEAAVAGTPTTLEVDANARAAGNERPAAVALGRALLAHPLAAQIVKIRVERAGAHVVAGLTLSGVKLRRPVGSAEFLREANALVDRALAAEPQLEEVDVTVTIPLEAGIGPATNSDFGRATSRTVFTLTVRRAAPAVREAFWDAAWRAGLDRVR